MYKLIYKYSSYGQKRDKEQERYAMWCIKERPLYCCINAGSTPHRPPFLLLITFLSMPRKFDNQLFKNLIPFYF